MQPEDPFIARIGMFFLVLGGGAFILFVVSDIADQVDFDYLFLALLLFAIGWPMWRQKPPPQASGRFSWFRKMREDARLRREERFKPKAEEKKE